MPPGNHCTRGPCPRGLLASCAQLAYSTAVEEQAATKQRLAAIAQCDDVVRDHSSTIAASLMNAPGNEHEDVVTPALVWLRVHALEDHRDALMLKSWVLHPVRRMRCPVEMFDDVIEGGRVDGVGIVHNVVP